MCIRHLQVHVIVKGYGQLTYFFKKKNMKSSRPIICAKASLSSQV